MIPPASPYHNADNIDDVVRNFSRYLAGQGHARIRLSVLIASDSLNDIISIHPNFITVNKLDRDNRLFRCEIKGESSPVLSVPDRAEWIIWRYDESEIYLLISVAKYDVYFNKILRILNLFYPRIATAYYNTSQIFDFLKSMDQSSTKSEIRVSKLVTKQNITSTGSRKKIASSIGWTDIPYIQAIKDVRDSESWVKSLDFYIKDENRQETFGSIARSGNLTCRENFFLFFYSVIHIVLSRARYNYDFLRDRARTKANLYASSPLNIKFEEDIFKNKVMNKKLISSLTKMPHSSLSVYHANPYLHASLLDYKDGSTYRLWVLSDNTITIVPQLRATVASLERLINHIGEHFMEGEVSNLT